MNRHMNAGHKDGAEYVAPDYTAYSFLTQSGFAGSTDTPDIYEEEEKEWD